MIFRELTIKGAYLIELERKQDARGFFARGWCQHEFEAQGLPFNVVQTNISVSTNKGTIRGLHWQVAPYGEAKLVRCVRGAIFDVLIDLRPHSSTYKHWFGLALRAEEYKMLFVPEYCAHGYQALEDNSEVNYHVSQFYSPGYERGVRPDDPGFGIEWPIDRHIVSDKDRSWPDYME